MTLRIRTLEAEDAPAYFELRLRALREHPEAFATAYEEDRGRPLEEVALRLTPGPGRISLGGFDGHRLVGSATVLRRSKVKQCHRAVLVAMYVAPEARGAGLGRALLQRVLGVVRGWEGVTDVALAVTVGNRAARALYQGAGFVPYGVEPRGLCVDGRCHDVEWMNLGLGSMETPPPRT